MAAASASSPQDSQPPSSSRRLPPPCWSHDEIVALIDAYREKWYSLRRGNLRAPHWQEVADAVGSRCPIAQPKTAVQCRHKMEKLRKRYRAELQRSFSTPNGHRYCSSWLHFKRMDSMEKGSTAPVSVVPANAASVDPYDDQEEAKDPFQNTVKHAIPYNGNGFYGPVSNGIGGGGSGFRIRIPSRPSTGLPVAKIYNKYDDISDNNPDSNPSFYGSTKVGNEAYSGRFGLEKKSSGDATRKKRDSYPLDELISAINMLGSGFVRMEKLKMEMAREVEQRRMEMELKRTEMIIESQQRIVEAFFNSFSDRKNKKVKRMSSPES